MSEVIDPIYRVVEDVDGRLQGKVTTGPYRQGGELSHATWNDKKRIYTRLQEARAYRDRLIAQGREARILKFVYEDEVSE